MSLSENPTTKGMAKMKGRALLGVSFCGKYSMVRNQHWIQQLQMDQYNNGNRMECSFVGFAKQSLVWKKALVNITEWKVELKNLQKMNTRP